MQRIHENKLKVTLSAEDMRELALDYTQMDHSDPSTRRALADILDRARNQVQFDPQGARLFIEVLPCDGGGCVVCFTCLHSGLGRSCTEPVLFEFDDMQTLLDGAAGVYRQYRQRIHRSMLYRMDGKYRLVLYPLDYADRLSVYFLGEYGRKVGEGRLSAAYTDEHGQAVIAEEAIETLARYFGGED